MKEMGALAAAVLASLSQAVCAQAGDAVDRLKACSQFEGMERLKCVDELLGEIAEPPDSAPTHHPGFTIGRLRAVIPQSNHPTFLATRERHHEGMRMAGVPEG